MAREEAGRPAQLWVALAATGFGLWIAYRLKSPCALHPWVDHFQYRRLCYSDIQALFGLRGIAQGYLPYRDVVLEYPVLTGMFMDVAGRLLRSMTAVGMLRSQGDAAYLGVTSMLLAPLALSVTVLLRPRVTRARLMLWACRPGG